VQREQESTNALNRAYAEAYNPQTGEIDINRLRGSLSTGGFGSKLPGIEKGLVDLQTARTTQQKLQGDVAAQPTTLAAAQSKLLDDKLKQSRGFLETLDPASPDAAERYMQWHRANHADPVIGKALEARGITVDQSMARIQQLLQTPGGLNRLINESKLGTEKFMEMNKPQLSTKDTGNVLIDRTFQPLTGQITEVSRTPKMMAPGEQERIDIGRSQLRTSQGQLSLAQEKFAFEQANPGFELKEAEDGSIVGVNKRTLQAFPVSIGGAAPAAAPAAPGAGMPGPRMPAPATQAIPGMTSVLDQPAVAAAPGVASAAGPTQLRGKSTALNEGQANATAFGIRMLEAETILEDLAKKGVLKGAVIEQTPFIGGTLGRVLPSALGGTSTAQQQVNQAKSNFITAVLRKESGAVISDSEFAREDEKYFPQINDNPEVVKQKARARRLAIESMKIQAGPGAKNISPKFITGIPSAVGATNNDPLGLGIRGQ
jgi:hypothetical protein